MADKIEVQLELEPILGQKAKTKIVKQSGVVGDKSGKKFSQGFGRRVGMSSKLMFSKLAVAAAGLGTVLTAVMASKKFVKAASVQQDAVKALEQSMKSAGTFTKAASRDFQEFASRLQGVSIVGDEAILKMGALARNFTKSNEEAKKLTQAAVELSAQTGTSFESSIINLGKSFGGLSGELGESVVQIRSLTVEQLKSGAALDLVLKRFGGAALAQTRTYTGALAQLTNTTGDLHEELGNVIVKSPEVVKLFNFIEKEIRTLNKTLAKTVGKNSFMTTFVSGFVDTLSFAVGKFAAPLEIMGNMFDEFVKNITFKFAVLKFAWVGYFNWLGDKIANFGVLRSTDKGIFADNAIVKGMQNLKSITKEELAEISADWAKSHNNIFGTPATEKMEAFMERMRQALALKIRLAGGAGAGEEKGESEDDSVMKSFGMQIDFIQEAKNKLLDYEVAWKKVSTAIKNSAVQGMGRGVAQGFTAVGAAMVNGEDALKAFGKAFAAAIGQAAVQLGTRFILEGVAISFNPLMGGPAVGGPLIAAGAALATFGGALGAMTAGGGAGAGAGGGVSDIGTGITDDMDESETIAEAPDSTAVTVVVQGDVLDSEESGLRIARILNDAFDKQGVVVKGVA